MSMSCFRSALAPAVKILFASCVLGQAFSIPAAAARLADFHPESLFEQNLGQDRDAVLFRARFPGIKAAVERDGSLVLLPRGSRTGIPVRIVARGARPVEKVEALEPSAFRTHYFRGGDLPTKVVDVPHFRRLAVPQVYPGIDLVYHARGRRLEFDFELEPGADPGRIVMGVEGASSVRIDAAGDLLIDAGGEILVQRRPVAYQLKEGRRVEIECAYRLAGARNVSLALGSFDPALALVIDPVVEYSSYLGGSGSDAATAIKVGPEGFHYVAGTTSSSNFPLVGAYDSTLGGATDAFVAKINPATGQMVYATYLGGANSDTGAALAVDAAGSVYVTGDAESKFPTTSGAYQTGSISQAGFVTKLTPAGNALSYSTFLYGTRPRAIEVDAQGRAAVTGRAGSAFVATANAYQAAFGGGEGDAFALMLNATGSAAVFATFVGGSETDEGRGIAIDASGRIVIGGAYRSTNLPAGSAIQASYAGVQDGFVAALAADGRSVAYATYFGGTGADHITGLAIDPYGNIVVSGDTTSSDFPTINARLPYSSLVNRGSPRKTFVAKFAPALAAVAFSTFAGSNANCCDFSHGVAVDGSGDIYLLGYLDAGNFSDFVSVHPFFTTSYASTKYATTNGDAAFAAGYSRNGQALRFQTLVSACGEARVCQRGAIAAGAAGQVAVAGETHVDWLPIAAFNTRPSLTPPGTGTNDAFVMTLGLEPPVLVLESANPSPVAATTVRLTATSYGAGTSGVVTFWDATSSIGTAPLVEGVATLDASFAAGVRRLKATLDSSETPLVLLPVTLPPQ